MAEGDGGPSDLEAVAPADDLNRRRADLARVMEELAAREARLDALRGRLERHASRAYGRKAKERLEEARKEREGHRAEREADFERRLALEPVDEKMIHEGLTGGPADAERVARRRDLELVMRKLKVREQMLREMTERLREGAVATKTVAPDKQMAARMLTYRLVPLWIFFIVFGFTLVWEAGVRGNPITAGKIQAALLIALFFALLIGAVVGIRYFNPQPPKA